MSSGLLWLLRKQRKAELIALLTQIALKVARGVILVVASASSASVDNTIPNAVRSQLSTKILLGSAPAELVRMVFRLLALGPLCSSA